MKIIATNKKATYNYEIITKIDAGLVLTGSEVKSLRSNTSSIKESYVQEKGNELWLCNCFIKKYESSSEKENNPIRSRKLLLNKKELAEIFRSTQQKGQTCVPTKLFWKKNLIKCEIALAVGKKSHDKRNTIKTRDWERQKAQELRDRNKN